MADGADEAERALRFRSSLQVAEALQETPTLGNALNDDILGILSRDPGYIDTWKVVANEVKVSTRVQPILENHLDAVHQMATSHPEVLQKALRSADALGIDGVDALFTKLKSIDGGPTALLDDMTQSDELIEAIATEPGLVDGWEVLNKAGLPISQRSNLPNLQEFYQELQKDLNKDYVSEIRNSGSLRRWLDDVAEGIIRMRRVESEPFVINPNHDAQEFIRQLKAQEDGMNQLTIKEFLDNRNDYIANGRSPIADRSQRRFREEAIQDRIDDNLEAGMTNEEAVREANEWIKDKAALHNPDQIAGGNPSDVTDLGSATINSSIGSQWRNKIVTIDEAIRLYSRSLTEEEKNRTLLNVILTINN